MKVFFAILPLFGVIIGAIIAASLQYLFSRSAERLKQFTTLKIQAYVDYLKTVSKLAHPLNLSENLSLLRELADAKTRICVYGSSQAVSLLAEFERQGATLSSKENISVFLRLCEQIRSEGLPKDAVSIKDMEIVLFESEVQPYTEEDQVSTEDANNVSQDK